MPAAAPPPMAVRPASGLMGKLAEVVQQQQQQQHGVAAPQAGAVQPGPPEDPSAQELESMLDELVEAYKAPEFQAELHAVQKRCLETGSNVLMAMAPVVLKVQAPVLRKYGQPPTFQGVDSMKHAVQRRVAEGAERLGHLANEARRLLCLEPMPERDLSVEQVLSSRLDATNERFAIGMEQLAQDRIAAERDSGALPVSSAKLLESMLNSDVPVPAVLSLLKMGRHGIHRRMLEGIDLPIEVPVLEAPSAEEFFRSHVLPNWPAVLRGTLDADRFPPLRDFPDLNFLRHNCGHRRVLVKSLAHEDRDGRPVFVTDPELKLPLAAFLDGVLEHEQTGKKVPFYLGKVPLKKELPELAQEIANAPTCPERIYGSCFGDLVPEGVFTYFGCGRNTTAVHYDGSENLLLCLSGTKRLWLFPPSEARHLYPCNDFTRSAVVPFADWEELDVELQLKFPLLSEVSYLEVRLEAGDLLYLPACWWHCVEGSEEPNMILNWWFGLHSEKKELAKRAA